MTRKKLLERIVKNAGKAIRSKDLRTVSKCYPGKSDVCTQGDFASEKVIVGGIKDHFLQDKILSEETKGDRPSKDTSGYLWYLKPPVCKYLSFLKFFGHLTLHNA